MKSELTQFIDRLKKIGITIECQGNIPWIYLYKVNGNRVKENGNGGNHGYVIAWYPVKLGDGITLADDMSGVFKLIRKYK